MNARGWREKPDIELKEQLSELRKQLFHGQFRAGQDEVEERGMFKKARREVARLLTLLHERESGIRGARALGSDSSAEPNSKEES